MKVPLAVRALPSVAEKVWWTPPRSRSMSLESTLAEYEEFEPISVEFGSKQLSGFRVGEGPIVVLIHGWGGQAAQMAPLAQTISREGFAAVAIDLPGHGKDEQRTSDAFQMAAAVRALIDEVGEPEAVVAHSLGAIASQIAFDGGWPARAVLIAPLLDADHAMNVFAGRAKLLPWTSRMLRRRFATFVGDEWWPQMTRGSDVDLGETEMLIVQDRGDSEAPFDMSAALAAKRPVTDLVVTSGLGHNRLLVDGKVVGDVVGFLAESPPPSTAPVGA